jgi:hypothetical protein
MACPSTLRKGASYMESVQIKLKLTSDPEILAALEKRRRFSKNHAGDKVLVLQFDSFPFEFKPGRVLTLDGSIAQSLRRESRVIIGDDLTGPMKYALDVAGKVDMGRGQEEADANACTYCHRSFPTASKLGWHLMHEHKEEGEAEAAEEAVEAAENVVDAAVDAPTPPSDSRRVFGKK